MSEQTRSELIDAIRMDRIDNATLYAEEFATRHDLNPQTVRSAISRFRRELGLLKRVPQRTHVIEIPRQMSSGHEGMYGLGTRDPSVTAMTILSLEATNPTVARVGAAVLLRYQEDDDFRRAVDEQRPEIETMFQRINELRQMADDLPPAERAELLRLLQG